MARPKKEKTIRSINFDRIVLQALEIKCKSNGIPISEFVNNIIKRQFFKRNVNFDLEFVEEITRQKAAEFYYWKTHKDTLLSKINPIKKKK